MTKEIIKLFLVICFTIFMTFVVANRNEKTRITREREIVLDFIKDSAYQLNALGDYQIFWVEDSLIIRDGRRHVGTLPLDSSDIGHLVWEDQHE